MAYFFLEELFHKLHCVRYHMLSIAFVNLEIEKLCRAEFAIQVERPEGKLRRVSDLPIPSPSGWFPFHNYCNKPPAAGAWIARLAAQLTSLHPEISTT